MITTIDPFKASYVNDYKANLFLEDYAENYDALRALRDLNEYEEKSIEKEKFEDTEFNNRFLPTEENLLRNHLNMVIRYNNEELACAKSEKNIVNNLEYCDYGNVTSLVGENAKKFSISLINSCKKSILSIYTVKQKIYTIFNNSFVIFSEKFLDPSNKNKVFKMSFMTYDADKIFSNILDFINTIKTNKTDMTFIYNQIHLLEESIKGLKKQFEGQEKTKYRFIPFNIFKDKYQNCISIVNQIIKTIESDVSETEKNLLKDIKDLTKFDGDEEKGRAIIKDLIDLNRFLQFMTFNYITSFASYAENLFDALNKIEIISRGA